MPVMRRWALASAALLVAAGLGLAAGLPAHASGGQEIMDNIRNSSTGQWQGWEPPAQPTGDILDYPAVAADSADDSIHVDVVTTTGFWDISRGSNGQWSKWAQPESQPPNDQFYQVYSVSEPNGGIEYYQISHNHIWSDFRFPDGSWLGWAQTSQTVPEDTDTLAATAAGVNGNFVVQVVAMTTGGAIWHTIYNPGNGSWQNWAQPVQVPSFAQTIAAAGLRNGDAEFIAVGNNGMVYHNIRFADGSWQKAQWVEPAQPPAGWWSPDSSVSVSAAADYNGNAQFVIWYLNLSNSVPSIYHTIRYSDGSWQKTGWGKPGLAPGYPACSGDIAIPTWNSNDTNLHLDALCVP